MSESISRAIATPSGSFLRALTWIALAVGALLTATWLWSTWCGFPANPWNDIRVAPAVALHRGISIYNAESFGPASTWIYGPLPLLLMWPAGLAPSAMGAMQMAGAIHIALTVIALTLTCLFWPAPRDLAEPSQSLQSRVAAALLCILFVRNQSAGYLVYTADAPGIVFALLGLLALSRHRYWTAATCAAAAAACKQTLVGVAIAQVVWVFVALSPRAALQHLCRCLLVSFAIALLAVYYFGAAGLWHTMVQIPSKFPWAALLDRINEHLVYAVVHIVLPIAIIVVGRTFFFDRKSPALLPTLAFFCTLPLSIAGLLKIGGNINSLHSFWLWFPPSLTAIVTGRAFHRFDIRGKLAMAMMTVLVASLWLQTSHLRMLPNIQAYREATYLAARLREKIWFPMHPLVTLYSEGRLYHDFDGITERSIAKKPVSDQHFFAHVPAKRQATATLLPVGWGPADTTEARLEKNAPVRTFGLWRLEGYFE